MPWQWISWETGDIVALVEAAEPKLGKRGPYKSRQAALPKGTEMGRPAIVVLYVVAMIAVIVGLDFLFFRNRFWERLMVNVGIVLVFAAFYFRFLSDQISN